MIYTASASATSNLPLYESGTKRPYAMIAITRRTFLESVCTVSTTASSLSLPVRGLHADEVILACTEYAEHRPSRQNLYKIDLSNANNTTTGNHDLDYKVRDTILNCYHFFHFTPIFYYVLNDPLYAYNAVAMTSNSTLFGDISGEVGFGIPYLQLSLSDDPVGDDAIRIIAHEFGHILQYNIRYPDNVLLYNLLHPDGSTDKRVELHADVMSGVYLATRYAQDRHHDMSVLNSTIQGDDNFTSPHHHGTTMERRQAFRHGFNRGLAEKSITANTLFELALDSAAYVMSEFE